MLRPWKLTAFYEMTRVVRASLREAEGVLRVLEYF